MKRCPLSGDDCFCAPEEGCLMEDELLDEDWDEDCEDREYAGKCPAIHSED